MTSYTPWASLWRTASLLGRRRCVAWSVWVVMLIAVGLFFSGDGRIFFISYTLVHQSWL